MIACFITLAVLYGAHGDGVLTVRRDAIASLIAFTTHPGLGKPPEPQTRLRLLGEADPIYSALTPAEILKLPCDGPDEQR